MWSVLTKYGLSKQPVTITLDGLEGSIARQSSAISNFRNYADALLFLDITFNVDVDDYQHLYIYGYGTSDDGTTYTGSATGTDSAITLSKTFFHPLPIIGVIPLMTATRTYYVGPLSVAAAFNGELPSKWGIVFANVAQALTESGNMVFYQGVNRKIVS